MKDTFQEGQWLIRSWNKEWNSDVDFVKFDSKFSSDEFRHSAFYRFNNDVLIFDISEMPEEDNLIEYHDSRLEDQFRPATQEEIEKYTTILKN